MNRHAVIKTVVTTNLSSSIPVCKENQPVHSGESTLDPALGGNDAKAESSVLCLPHAKS